MFQRSGLGVGVALMRAGTGVRQQVQPFGVGRHQAVLDAVVHHLHHVARTARPAVEEALLGIGRLTVAAWRPPSGVDSGRQGLPDRTQPLEVLAGPADHQRVAALQAPDAAGGADIEVADAASGQRLGSGDVVVVVGVAAIDDHVAGTQHVGDRFDGLGGDRAGRHHHPHRTRPGQLCRQIFQ